MRQVRSEVALDAFRTPWRHLGTAGCAAGADVKPGSLEGPGLAETPRDRVGSQEELCPRPPRRSLEKRKQLRECCEASDTSAAVLGWAACRGGDGVGAAGDTGWRVQEALSGLSMKRKTGCRRSEIQEVLVLGAVTARLWAGRRGRGHVMAEEGCGEAWTGPGTGGKRSGRPGQEPWGWWSDGTLVRRLWTFSSVQRVLAPSGEAGA